MRPDNPTMLRLYRAGELESLHRGAWVLTDTTGTVIDGVGDPHQAVFPRSATKSLQAIPFVETGAADHFGMDERHLALAIASHSGEPVHAEVALDGLALLGLDEDALLCGPQRPMVAGPEVQPRRITNNCSGKHVGFLAVARHLDVEPSTYLDPDGPVQQLVRQAVEEMSGADPDQMVVGIDGCSAPTFHFSLSALAVGLARVTNPDALPTERADACRRLTAAARSHPDLVAGNHERFCTDLLRATDGRVFGKIGAEGVYTLGVVGSGYGFAGKVDDGNARGLYPLIIDLLTDRDLMSAAEAAALAPWGDTTLKNWDGLEVGRLEIVRNPASPR